MILTLWITFLALAFLLLTIGYIFYNTQVSDILIIVGWLFIFALGVILLSNAVEYQTGETEVTVYTYTEHDYSVDGSNFTDVVINSSTTTNTKDYENFVTEGTGILKRVANSHLWGFFLMICGLFGSILFWFDTRAYSQEEEEREINEEY